MNRGISLRPLYKVQIVEPRRPVMTLCDAIDCLVAMQLGLEDPDVERLRAEIDAALSLVRTAVRLLDGDDPELLLRGTAGPPPP